MEFDFNIIQHEILENISEGIIAIDCDEKIRIINRKAKEIFGIVYKQPIGHPSGKISNGDIVIIAENCFGTDDGGMGVEELKLLGVYEKIPQNSAFIYIGKYNEGGEYIFTSDTTEGNLRFERIINGRNIEIFIDFIYKNINIKVDEYQFPYSFVKAIGHMVIIDNDEGNIKFYQGKGYSIRKEDIRSILRGKEFLQKIAIDEMEIDVIGDKVDNILGNSKSIDMLRKALESSNINYIGKYDEINGWPVKSSVHSIKHNRRYIGSFLRVEDLSELNKIVKEKEEILKKFNSIQESVYDSFNVILGDSESIKKMKTYSRKVALTSSTILILGESGTGKSLLAKAIHDYSSRNKEKFVEINCGSLSENLLESELFGYESGAFTGAKKEGKKGLIEYANGGTVFLDEISEIPLNLQVKLLHVIQNKRITPVGGVKTVQVNVRFICAANKDLKDMVEKGLFREDLYYRINVMQVNVPPLRERKEDLYQLTQDIIHKICRRDGIQYRVLSNEGFNKLYSYNFPGNIRELENIIERALSIAEGDFIDEESILLWNDKFESNKTLKEILEDSEKKAIINYMKKYNGDKSKVMKVLNIKKTAFYDKLKKYSIQ